MKATIAILALALSACAHIDPSASRGDIAECKHQGKEAATHAHSAWQITIPGAIIDRHVKQTIAINDCMRAKGYRTTAQR